MTTDADFTLDEKRIMIFMFFIGVVFFVGLFLFLTQKVESCVMAPSPYIGAENYAFKIQNETCHDGMQANITGDDMFLHPTKLKCENGVVWVLSPSVLQYQEVVLYWPEGVSVKTHRVAIRLEDNIECKNVSRWFPDG